MAVKKRGKKESKKIKNNLCSRGKDSNPCGGFGYFLGIIGAAIYYISTSTGFWMGVLGLLKALVWPAFLIFELLKFLGA